MNVFKERAIQLVDIDDTGRFEINSDGMNFLSALKNKKVYIKYKFLS